MKTRRTYHHGNLQDALVVAALGLLDERGLEGLSVREVARRAGVSSGAPFRHFADKEALLAEVARQTWDRFLRATDDAIAAAGLDALERFQAVGVAFVRFAVEHPAHFRVMFRPEVAEHPSEAVLSLRTRSRTRLRQLVVEAQASGQLLPGPPEPIMMSAYALCYGLARIYVDGLTTMVGLPALSPEEVARTVTSHLGKGIERR